MSSQPRSRPRVAFVLGGGGHLGAYEVGMLQALIERDVVPDLVVGTSVGALNGAAVAVRPSLESVERLRAAWLDLGAERIFRSPLSAGMPRRRAALHSAEPLRRLVERVLPVRRFEELEVPFQCVAANVERGAEHWFHEGPLADAILASSAIPGLLPVIELDGEHFIDGGIVNSIPVGRAVELGASAVYVLHVGRIDRPLQPPRTVVQALLVAFEIARRHRFARDMAAIPPGVTVHVLPTGEEEPSRYESLAQLRYRDFSRVADRIASAHRATADYLERTSAAAPD